MTIAGNFLFLAAITRIYLLFFLADLRGLNADSRRTTIIIDNSFGVCEIQGGYYSAKICEKSA
jgi:hypothetical protein